MDEKRQGEIALAVFKQNLRQEGLHLKPLRKKDLRKKAKFIGISAKEAREFVETITREFVEEVFPPKKEKKK